MIERFLKGKERAQLWIGHKHRVLQECESKSPGLVRLKQE